MSKTKFNSIIPSNYLQEGDVELSLNMDFIAKPIKNICGITLGFLCLYIGMKFLIAFRQEFSVPLDLNNIGLDLNLLKHLLILDAFNVFLMGLVFYMLFYLLPHGCVDLLISSKKFGQMVFGEDYEAIRASENNPDDLSFSPRVNVIKFIAKIFIVCHIGVWLFILTKSMNILQLNHIIITTLYFICALTIFGVGFKYSRRKDPSISSKDLMVYVGIVAFFMMCLFIPASILVYLDVKLMVRDEVINCIFLTLYICTTLPIMASEPCNLNRYKSHLLFGILLFMMLDFVFEPKFPISFKMDSIFYSRDQ